MSTIELNHTEKEFIDQVVRDGEDYFIELDIILDDENGMQDIPGYRPFRGLDENGEEFSVLLEQSSVKSEWLRYRADEYARIHGVEVETYEEANRGNGFPTVGFKGAFTAIYDLYMRYDGEKIRTDARDQVRQIVDAK